MRKILALTAMCLLCTSALAADSVEGKTLSSKNWWDNKFILSTFTSFQHGDNIEKIVALLSEAGLNAMESNCPLEYSANDPTKEEFVRALKACGKYDLKFLITDHKRMTGVSNPPEDALKSLVDDYSSYPALGGYYVWDEPGVDKFGDVRRMYDLLHKLDPKRLCLNAIMPSYGPYKHPKDYADYVRGFVKQVDPPVLSFDFYSVYQTGDSSVPVGVNQDLYRDLALWSNVSLETGKPLWMYVTACQWGANAKPTRATLSFQVYTAIAYGVKGIQYFECRGFSGGAIDFVDAPVNGDGTKGPTFDLFKSFNAEINVKAQILARLKLVKVMHTAPVPLDNAALEPGFWGIKSASDNLTISCLTGPHSKRYLVVVNKDVNFAHDVFLQFEGSTSLVQVPENTQLRGKDNRISFTLAPGGGKLFEIRK